MCRTGLPPPITLLLVVIVVSTGCSAVPDGSTRTPVPIEPSVLRFTAAGGTCVEEPRLGWRIERSASEETTIVTVHGNASVPGNSSVLDEPSVTRTGPATYALNVTSRRATSEPGRHCRAVARYTVDVRLPRGPDDQFTLVVYHDGQEATAVGFDPGRSGAGANASAKD